MGDTNGRVIAGGNGQGKRLDQVNYPIDVLIDKETDSLIICDQDNYRVVRWSHRSGTTQGEILINNIWCSGLAMDNQRYLYISDVLKKEVRRYQTGDKNGTIVAGGNGQGADLNRLDWPTYIFVDQQQTVYVSEHNNRRVVKWNKGAKEGIVVAGGQDAGNALTQLPYPQGLFVDTLGTIYVADSSNHRVMRWPKGAKQGTVIVGGNGQGNGANQFSHPMGLPGNEVAAPIRFSINANSENDQTTTNHCQPPSTPPRALIETIDLRIPILVTIDFHSSHLPTNPNTEGSPLYLTPQ
ncbi:unnamed protein product [Rotaria sordida]|uniref:NHL repeat-containing protein n=1 Tax=Rotaria sordida TaxID=392033 RepID=A0A816AYX9_9BILA|nr:unnamed protein product [Rotaria sordida]CAF1604464.1 unnamed protein product [Rotaria sordida]